MSGRGNSKVPNKCGLKKEVQLDSDQIILVGRGKYEFVRGVYVLLLYGPPCFMSLKVFKRT